jgi:hypothetical protein
MNESPDVLATQQVGRARCVVRAGADEESAPELCLEEVSLPLSRHAIQQLRSLLLTAERRLEDQERRKFLRRNYALPFENS